MHRPKRRKQFGTNDQNDQNLFKKRKNYKNRRKDGYYSRTTFKETWHNKLD